MWGDRPLKQLHDQSVNPSLEMAMNKSDGF
jgi:hypothetical protein